MKQARNPGTIHPPVGRYVHHIEVSGESRLLFISGQVGMRPDGTVPDDPTDQLVVAYENVLRNLDAAGFETTDLVKVTFYLVHGAFSDADIPRRREALGRLLGEHVTTSTLIYVAGLAAPQYKVEIDAWAVREG